MFLHILEGRVSYQFDESASAFNTYPNLDVLIELLVQQNDLYSQQNRRNFLNIAEEMKAFIGVNYIMAVNQLPNIPVYWNCNHFVGNVGIQNIFTRTRYEEVLQNLHFANNTKQDKTY